MASVNGDVSGTGGTVDERLASTLSSSSQFSVASYLNLALKEAYDTRDGDALQRRMAELALQLQIQTQSCHEDIGRIGAELQAIMPRCAADVGRVGVGLEGMKIDAASLLSSGNTGSNQEISDSMETLSTLHALQSNLKKTKDVLAAAASWDSTLSSIAPLLSQQNLTEAVSALAKLESGERALRGMPKGKEERQESISKIRQQVQVMLQPQLKHALQNMSTRISPLQQCVSMYTALGKMDSLKQEYIKNRPMQVHKLWFSYKAPTMQSYNQTMTEKDLFDGVDEDPSIKAERDASDPAAAFVSWLPSWYDTVLTLLAEERRQSLSVFGPDLAPEMIAKVLGECFRPILSSFESRLKSIYPPKSTSSSSSPGSLESICAIYESTLQFLSLAYESVAGSWLDEHQAFSSGNSKESAMAAFALYNELRGVFLIVGSPFGKYQKRFAELEQVHSGASTSLVAKDIQQAVSTVSQNSEESLVGLQDATERLKGLAPFIFQIVEDGLVRFELLNAGYNAPGALSSIDKLLSSHAGELAIAITTLSASLTADQNRLADTFDEQHVHCALEVLKVAGAFRRGLREFKSKTRERLGVLSERMAAQLAHEKELLDADASGGVSSSTGPSFVFPDSLSVVEIDSLLTREVCADKEEQQMEESNTAYTNLQRLSNPENERTAALYPGADDATTKLATSCHTLVFDVCAAVPQRQLNMMSAMSSWREPADTDEFGSYGTLPQEYITHVGEHMLALVQALEPFASDTEALALANDVMNGAHEVAKQPWREFVSAVGSEDANADEVIQSLMKGKDLAEFGIVSDFLDDEEVEHEEEDEASKASTAFCNSWLDVVGLAVTGRLLERIMRIPHLTPKGCEHLSADLGYLINVFSALGVSGHPHPLLNYFSELAMVDSDMLKERINSRDQTKAVAVVIRAAEVRIALMRGIALN